jgi:hypothetical protein
MMAINDMMAPAEDEELQAALNNKALQVLMTQQDAAGLPGMEAGVPPPEGELPPELLKSSMAPAEGDPLGGPDRKLHVEPRDGLQALLDQAKLGGGGGLPLPGGGGSSMWKAPLAAGAMLGGMPSGLGGLIKKPALPGGVGSVMGKLPARLPGVPGSSAIGGALKKAPVPALSRGLPGVPGSKAVGKAIGKTPGLKSIGKGIGKLFGRR